MSLLAVLSHVSHGYVGNRAMVFALQMYGWDVDAINTTNYSNHPGYLKFKGSATEPTLIDELFSGLKQIMDFATDYDVILTGYVPSAPALEVVVLHLNLVFSAPTKCKWVVDPVLGDNGKFYVPKEMVDVYRRVLSSGFVTLTTPNQFEFETLANCVLDGTWESVKNAFKKFTNEFKVDNVVLSLVVVEGQLYTVGWAENRLFAVEIPMIECSFNGCGDVFTALVTNEFYTHAKLTPEALLTAVGRLNKILVRSLEIERKKAPDTKLVKDIRLVSLRKVLTEDVESLKVVHLGK